MIRLLCRARHSFWKLTINKFSNGFFFFFNQVKSVKTGGRCMSLFSVLMSDNQKTMALETFF